MMMLQEDLEAAIKDCLINADLWIGGAPGIRPAAYEDEIISEMQGRGLIGPRGGLTRRGLSEAKIAAREYWDD